MLVRGWKGFVLIRLISIFWIILFSNWECSFLVLKIDLWEKLNDNKKDELLKDLFNYNGNINDLTKYFEKYRLFLLKSSLNLFTKGVIKPDF